MIGIREADGLWHLETEGGALSARALANLAGPWIDGVAALDTEPHARMVNTTRGAHLVMSLPERFRGHGIMTMSGLDHPFYCFPWRDRHFIGPTEVSSTEDPDTVRPETSEKHELLANLDRQLPGLDFDLGETPIGWAGLRPLTHEPSTMMAARMRIIHSLGRRTGPKFVALTNGSIGAHAITATDLANAIGLSSANRHTPPVLAHAPGQGDAHVRHLTDLLWRREGSIWDGDAGEAQVSQAATALAQQLGWDEARRKAEIAAFRSEQAKMRYAVN